MNKSLDKSCTVDYSNNMEYGQYKATSKPTQYPREAYRFKPSETSVQLRADESQVDPGAAATRPVPTNSMEDVMNYYEKQNGSEIFIMSVGENGDYSVASNLDPEPDGFIAPAPWRERGYAECSKERAEQVLGYEL